VTSLLPQHRRDTEAADDAGAAQDGPLPPSTAVRRPPRVVAAARLGRLAEVSSRVSGLGAGGVIGGRVLLALAPHAVPELARGRSLALVSGTNGKTTTTALLTAALRTRAPVDTNADGANTQPGMVRTLAAGDAATVVLETDEGWLPWAVRETGASTVVLLNLSRDQLHRHHEVAHVAHAWRRALDGVEHVVANADDPAVVLACLGARHRTWVAAGTRWREDARVCPRCGHEILSADGGWRCRCGLCRPRPQWWTEGDDLVGPATRLTLGLGLPGAANRSNAAMAVAAASALGVSPLGALSAMRTVAGVAGRYEVFATGTHRARLTLAKNPASWLEALDMVGRGSRPLVLAFNSDGVDGRDPSWLYDVPFDGLAGRPVVVTGRRATDMLVRLEMAGLRDVRRAGDVAAAMALLPAGEVDVVANYTAFQEARRVLGHWSHGRWGHGR
jgi:lipid II isoglutaminyl synthase (glutamine-hydrolysing)